jgi:hypothetical protein
MPRVPSIQVIGRVDQRSIKQIRLSSNRHAIDSQMNIHLVVHAFLHWITVQNECVEGSDERFLPGSRTRIAMSILSYGRLQERLKKKKET